MTMYRVMKQIGESRYRIDAKYRDDADWTSISGTFRSAEEAFTVVQSLRALDDADQWEPVEEPLAMSEAWKPFVVDGGKR